MLRLRVVVLVCACLTPCFVVAQDRDADGIPDATEIQLLYDYAPQLRFHPKERHFPASVDWTLWFPEVELIYDDGSCVETVREGSLTSGLVPQDLLSCSMACGGVCGDDPGGRSFYVKFDPASHRGPSSDFDRIVYGHVYPQHGYPAGRINIQYWVFYPFNWALHRWFEHQGDWEDIIVVVDSTTHDVHELWYAQHGKHSRYLDNVIWVSDDGADSCTTGPGCDYTHPVVYVANNSHASYNRPLRKIARQDFTDDGGRVWQTWDPTIPGNIRNVGERHDFVPFGTEWLNYRGIWGRDGRPAGPPWQSGWRFKASYEICNNGLDDDVDGVLDEPESSGCVPYPDLVYSSVEPKWGFDTSAPIGTSIIAPGDYLPYWLRLENQGGLTPGYGTTGPEPVLIEVSLARERRFDPDHVFSQVWFVNGFNGSSATDETDVYTRHGFAQCPTLTDGVYYVGARVDGVDGIFEGDETNNELASTYAVEVVSNAYAIDNFNDGADDGWDRPDPNDAGNWSTSEGFYRINADGSDQFSRFTGPWNAVTTLQFDFMFEDGTAWAPEIGAMLRWTRDGWFDRVRLFNTGGATSTVRLEVYEGNTLPVFFVENTFDGDLKGSHRLLIEKTGCGAQVYLDGELILETTYQTHNFTGWHGWHGIVVSGLNDAVIDNFVLAPYDNDQDDDGFPVCGDCDDSDPEMHNGDLDDDGSSLCDGDCDDNDPTRSAVDADNDGWSTCDGDCNDGNGSIRPGVQENCETAYDDNCNGSVNEGCSPKPPKDKVQRG